MSATIQDIITATLMYAKCDQKTIDKFCSYCLAEGKLIKAAYRTRYNTPICQRWESLPSHRLYITTDTLTPITKKKEKKHVIAVPLYLQEIWEAQS